MEGVWRECGGCVEGVWRECGGCVEGVFFFKKMVSKVMVKIDSIGIYLKINGQ